MRPKTINGLYAVTPDTADLENLLLRVEACLMGGARVVQYRNKTADAPHLAMATALARLCRQYGVPLIVNDDIELALAAGADGVHLGREDGDVVSARRQLGADSMIGISCYGDLQLAFDAQQGGANYVAFGSMFASPTKPHARHAPLSLLTDAAAQLHIPIVAIGGITLQNALPAIVAGADAIAVISAVFDAPDVQKAAQNFSNLFKTT
jgi:thiamine-phosphate pyrophosphorylase